MDMSRSWRVVGNFGWGLMEEDEGWRKGPWTTEEDSLLLHYINSHGEGRWNSVARTTGLKRNGKSCRLRWVNYLRPDLKRGHITPHEEKIILELHARWGNRWSTIARSLPGRTDNEIKNYWRTHFKKKANALPESSKTKNRFLKMQQVHQHQHQHEQQQLNQSDIIKATSILEENNENDRMLYVPQVRQAMETTATVSAAGAAATTNCAAYPVPPYMVNANLLPTSVETLEWDGMWNLDDIYPDFGIAARNTTLF